MYVHAHIYTYIYIYIHVYILPGYCIKSAYVVTIVLSVLVQQGPDRLAKIDNGEGDREVESLPFSILVHCGAVPQATYFEFCSLAI